MRPLTMEQSERPTLCRPSVGRRGIAMDAWEGCRVRARPYVGRGGRTARGTLGEVTGCAAKPVRVGVTGKDLYPVAVAREVVRGVHALGAPSSSGTALPGVAAASAGRELDRWDMRRASSAEMDAGMSHMRDDDGGGCGSSRDARRREPSVTSEPPSGSALSAVRPTT